MGDVLAIDKGDTTFLASVVAGVQNQASEIHSEEQQHTTLASQTSATLTSSLISEVSQETANRDGIEITPGGKPAAGVEGALSSALPSSSTATPHSESSQQNSSREGLSEGAKAGIAVGAIFGVFSLLALIFLCLRRRQSKRKTAGGYYGDAPGSSNDIREKEASVGIAAIPVNASLTSEGHHALNGNAALLGRERSGRVVDGASLERVDMGEHAAPVAGVRAAGVVRKPVGARGGGDGERGGREGAISVQSQVLTDDERARWEEEERRLDEDIAEAERRRRAQ